MYRITLIVYVLLSSALSLSLSSFFPIYLFLSLTVYLTVRSCNTLLPFVSSFLHQRRCELGLEVREGLRVGILLGELIERSSLERVAISKNQRHIGRIVRRYDEFSPGRLGSDVRLAFSRSRSICLRRIDRLKMRDFFFLGS